MLMSVQPLPRILATVSLLAGSSACEREFLGRIDSSTPTVHALPPPVMGVALDRPSPTNRGLISGLDERGYPLREGGTVDPRIIEARRFYDVLRYPGAQMVLVDYADPFNGDPAGMRLTAPLTLQAWKAAFGFPAQTPGEPLGQYRQRERAVVYYNKNELGLGRELACADFVDGMAPDGEPLIGVACFVTNYGSVFRDEVRSLAEAIEGTHPRNTVCITWRPSMDPGYQVQFYVYDGDGQRLEWAQLDNFGPRPHPQVCTGCHGGSYDESRHLAKFARFLPLDPNLVVFASDPRTPPELTRAGQEERIRLWNAASLRTPLTPPQKELLQELYAGRVEQPGGVSQPSWRPAAWKGDPAQEALFDNVVKPFCGTCHLAGQTGADGNLLPSAGIVLSPDRTVRQALRGVVCGTFAMPNAQPTLVNFWGPALVPIASHQFASAADAFLDSLGMNRATCPGLSAVDSCNRGPDPDANCGNDRSGTACNRVTGLCVPDFRQAPVDDGQPFVIPRGLCRQDGARRCPPRLECVPAGNLGPGLETFDGSCEFPRIKPQN
jgi:hypothetical protein